MTTARTARRAALEDLDLVGIPDIADRLGVTGNTVNHWRWKAAKGDGPARTYYTAGGAEATAEPLPDPDATVAGTPIWLWATIAAWAERTGRTERGTA